jgi:hypothetical protein
MTIMNIVYFSTVVGSWRLQSKDAAALKEGCFANEEL